MPYGCRGARDARSWSVIYGGVHVDVFVRSGVGCKKRVRARPGVSPSNSTRSQASAEAQVLQSSQVDCARTRGTYNIQARALTCLLQIGPYMPLIDMRRHQ
eukprot:4083990-Prymnesium_polylepis.1